MELDVLTGDLRISGTEGISIGETELQQAAVIVASRRGDFKELPLLGGEAGDMAGGNMDVLWPGRVRRMLRGCGIDCTEVVAGPEGVNVTIGG